MDDPELVNAFVTESREHLADIEQQLLAIESAGDQADAELVNTVFRAIHSIKGAAGFLGFTTMSRLAHGMENALNLLRQGRLKPSRALTDALLQSADALRAMLHDVEHSNEHNIEGQLGAIEAVVAQLLAEEQACSLPAAQDDEQGARCGEQGAGSREYGRWGGRYATKQRKRSGQNRKHWAALRAGGPPRRDSGANATACARVWAIGPTPQPRRLNVREPHGIDRRDQHSRLRSGAGPAYEPGGRIGPGP